MKKIWDTQNKEPMYAINEAALHRRILAKSKHARRKSNITEIGLVIITTITSILLLLIGEGTIYTYISAAAMFLIGGYVIMGRIQRKKRTSQYDRSILGDLDEAIANVNYETTRAKTFLWWFILPVALPALLNLTQSDAPAWKWLLIPGSFILAYAVVQFGLNRIHLPKKRELENLRKKLAEEV